jgi:hypothetical protein
MVVLARASLVGQYAKSASGASREDGYLAKPFATTGFLVRDGGDGIDGVAAAIGGAMLASAPPAVTRRGDRETSYSAYDALGISRSSF